ncbi:hypothetical protein [Halomicrobium katesii]|uniref:hypothetical protein n=1 Tax=Halomicrobium katesii TaxID=437163 RepID=UPI00036809EF|nr:hypothetical protein [Halomicrobium katesii]
MKAGIVGLLDSPSETIEAVDGITTQDGREYRYCIEPRETFTDAPVNGVIQTGEAAMEIPKEVERVEIEDGTITRKTTVRTETKHTEWLLIPDEIVVVENSEGRFFHDLLASEFGWRANRAQFDLTSMRSDYEETQLWQVGFYDHLGEAQKGVVYGEDVLDDQDLGSALDDSQINQLGLVYQRDGDTVKVTLAESGYVELYQPSGFDADDFAVYIQEEIRKYVSGIHTEK